jgi:fimbrial isopeptide formation D2 family protein
MRYKRAQLNLRRVRLLVLAGFLLVAMGGLLRSSTNTSAAEPPTVDSRIEVLRDGNPSFDGTTYGPGADGQFGGITIGDPLAADNTDLGTDSADNNGIVRASDDIVYRIQVSINGADANPLMATVTLSDGQAWSGVPADCVASGSSISADKLSLTCNLGPRRQGTLASAKLTAKVKASTPNNSLVSASVSATTLGGNTSSATSTETRVTSIPKVNLVKKVLNSSGTFTVQDPATGEMGKVIRYGIGLYSEKGGEALDGADISFTDSLSYPSSPVTPTYKLYNWGSSSACGQNTALTGLLPYGSVGAASGATAENSVTNSGSFNCSQSGGAGSPIGVTISGYDPSGLSVPSKYPNGSQISLDQNYFSAGYIDIWVPNSNFEDPANFTPGEGYALDTRNEFSAIDPNGVSGTSNYGSGTEPTSDNGASVTLINSTPGGGAQNTFQGEDGLMSKLGTATAYPGQLVYPKIWFANDSNQPNTYTICTKLNNAEMTLTGRFLDVATPEGLDKVKMLYSLSIMPFPGGTLGEFTIGPDGVLNTSDDGQVFKLNYVDPSRTFNGANLLGTNYGPFFGGSGPMEGSLFPSDNGISQIEYSSVPITDYATNTCSNDENGDGQSDWVSDPTSDPTNFPQGWASVTRMRVKGTMNPISDYGYDSTSGNMVVMMIPEMKVSPTLNPGAGLGYGNPSEPSAFVGLFSSFEDANGWTHSPLPGDTNNPFDQNTADRLEIVAATLRTDKETVPAGIKDVKAGDVVTYQIKTTMAGKAAPTALSLDDVLPAGMSYVPGSAIITPGAAGQLVNGVDPASSATIDPTISGTTLKWTIDNVTVGDVLPTITYQAQVNADVVSGEFTNVVTASETIASPLDVNSTVNQRSDVWTVKASSFGDYDVLKLLTTPDDALVERNQPFSFDLTYANTSNDLNINNLQFIEVFPYNNDGPRDPISNYQGQLQFDSITSSLPGAVYLYTDAIPSTISLDPCNQKNVGSMDPTPAACAEGIVDDSGMPTGGSGTGQTAWYDCSGGFGTGTCPIAQSAVTGIKIIIDGPNVLPAGSSRQKFTLTLQPTGNQGDDIYTNNFGSRVDVNDLVAISNDVSVRVIAGSIGDTVWYDIDRDGVQDPSELGIPNITLTLTGTDYGPDGVVGGGDDSPVSLTQVTDASGKYLFSGLGAGSYKVVATPPTGLDQTYDLDGIASANDSGSFSLAAGDNKLDVDFGYAGNAQAGDTVWYDIDRDGVQDPSELGIPNITLTLTGTDYGPDGVVGGGDDSPVSLTQVTDASGKYLFSGLGAGSYKVVATPPTGLDQTYDLDGIASANDSGSFSLAAGDNKLDVDFGYAGNAQAGDTVWYDIDRNGVQDPSELGIPNITLTLTGTDYGPDGVVGGGDDSPVSLTQATDASGKYLFSGLGAGSYKVVATPPTGLDQTYDLDGIASANDSGSFSLAAGDNKLDVDFGYAGIDDDNDGILNTDEDTNNDGNPANDDVDGDGTPNYLDLDSDGDGVNDIVEAGGIDADNNGLVDSTTDTDGDGLADTFDPDNGGTALALIDTDGDGNINAYDIDDDNDGILNTDEDTNNDGNPANDDVDGDGTPNYLDLDSDGDGVNDKDEITNGTNPYAKEAITTVVEESKPVITTNKDPIASTGENTKIIIAGATALILGAAGVMVVRRKK